MDRWSEMTEASFDLFLVKSLVVKESKIKNGDMLESLDVFDMLE